MVFRSIFQDHDHLLSILTFESGGQYLIGPNENLFGTDQVYRSPGLHSIESFLDGTVRILGGFRTHGVC